MGTALLLSLFVALFRHYARCRASGHPSGYAVRLGVYLQLAMMALLMMDGDSFFASVHIPAFLLAGYALSGPARQAVVTAIPLQPARPANLMA